MSDRQGGARLLLSVWVGGMWGCATVGLRLLGMSRNASIWVAFAPALLMLPPLWRSVREQLYWWRWRRYSARQKLKNVIDGPYR